MLIGQKFSVWRVLLLLSIWLGVNANSLAVTNCSTQGDIPATQCNALVDLYTSTNGASWTDSPSNNWNVTNTPCSSWTGVTCSGGNVIGISRNNKNLVGSIPNTITNLSFLNNLSLPGNQLSGSIPGLPAALDTLNLSTNQLSGAIPALPNGLILVYLMSNQLSGSIPTLPTGIKYFSTSANQLSGTIPTLPTTLLELALDTNQLTGSIPTLPSGLTALLLNGNRLTGTLPALPTGLSLLKLQNNALSGTLPSFASLTGLSSPNLDLGYNALTNTFAGETSIVSSKQSTWQDTQTVVPTGVTATTLSSSSVQLNWTPITYTGDGGYYQVKYATTPGGAYTNASSTTANKSANTYTVTGLSPSTTYYFVIETVTPSHGSQQNNLISTLSTEVSATTSAGTCTSTATVTNIADTGAGSLRTAVANLCPGGTIDFSSSLSNQTIVLASKITFTQNITLQNPNALGLSISGGNAIRLFHINAGVTVAMDKLKVTNGKSGVTDSSGGAFVNYGTLNFTNGKCSNNQAFANGGCIINHSGATLNFIASVCEQNQTTTYGGCLHNEGSVVVQGSVLGNNSVTAGGGGGAIFNTGSGTVEVKDSTLEKNSATSSGGAISSNGGTVTVTRSSFSQNTVTHYGGAIRNDAIITVSNSTFFNNTSSGSGALHNYAGSGSGTMTLINNTIAGNSSYGVMNNTSGTLHLKNNIIANNSSADCSNGGTLATNIKNLVKDNSCSPALSGDPQLATALALNGAPTGYPQTLALLPTSSAMNAADTATCSADPIGNVDQRNMARPQGSACDLGAYEAPLPAAPTALNIQSLSDTALKLSWTDNSDNEAGFKIERDGALLSTTAANVNNYTDTSVLCDKTYNYRLLAFNNVGDSSAVIATFSTPCTTIAIAGYQSQPIPDTTLDFGMSAINTPIQKTLVIQEIGEAALIINSVKISGQDAAAFTIVPPTASFFVQDGGAAYTLTLQCLPTQETIVSATLQLSTNDPNYPTVSYPLSCKGVKDSVNLNLSTSGSGEIATCGQSCTLVYPQNAPAILTATPATGWLFSHWSGDCSGNTNPLNLTMDATKTCQAVFIPQRTFTLFKTKYGEVSGAPGLLCPTVTSCGATYPDGELLTLTATPMVGYSFVEWTGDCAATTPTITLTMNGDKSCTASFAMTSSPVTLTVATVGSGTIQGCGQNCSLTYFKDTPVNLIATADPGWQLSGWSDECPNGQVTMSTDKNCTAYFVASSNAVTLTLNTVGQGVVAGCGESCTQAHPKDSTVNLIASPSAGWQFSGWSGDCVNGQVVMNADKTCTANFTAPTTTPQTGIPNVAPVNGTANGNMSNYNQTAVDLTVAPNGSVSGGILAGTVTNNGLISNVTIAPGTTVTGGKLSGFNINNGTLTDITLSQYSEIRGGYYSGTIHNEGVIFDPSILPNSTFYGGKVGGVVLNQGILQDVSFLPETLILGGTLSGNMVGDTAGYVIIGEANLTQIRLARACLTMTVQLGSNVKLDATVIRHPPMPLLDAEVEDFCIQPQAIPYFTKQRILGTEKLAFQAFEADNIADLPPIALEALIAEQFTNFQFRALGALTVEQYRHLPLSAFEGLHKDNLGGFSPQVIAQFDTSHFDKLQSNEFKQIPGFGIAKWLTNLNPSQLTAEKFIPNTWQLDATTGIFTAPAETQLAMKALEMNNLPENVRLPAYQFDAHTTFSLSGHAEGETLLQKVNRALQVQGVDFQAEQTEYGVILSRDAKNNRQFAFMLNSQKLLQRAETATVGAQLTETGEYQVMTVDDIEVNLSPAPKDPVMLAKTLGERSQVVVGERGDVFLSQVAAKSLRVREGEGDFVHVVIIFDPFVEPSFSDICHVNEQGETVCDWENAAAEMQPGLHFGAGARAKQQAKFIYPDGTAQQLYPTVFEPETFMAEARKFAGVEAVQLKMDGTFEVTYQGQKLQLFPDFAVKVTELEKYQHVKPSVKLTGNGVKYQVQHGQQLLTSELSFGQ